MKNMKKTEEMPREYEDADEPLYPYGLCITLDAEQLDKLGITTLPKVGGTMMIHAMAYVKSTSAYETQGGKDMSVQLQITDMDIGEEDRSKDRAETMYGKDKSPKQINPTSEMTTLLYGGS
tara:strand:- start:862 stop:1224 length:363 start_codon:yes stop_codon:yes gene_type:complete